ncbi:trans-resveratrol di-O-methyltransferase-like [Iris pallida]|uniref:Trans-resveratrol di-O-methyltransferase-like n=1 Tax=Iris pallida TaxID=29817 RepID=A0AAX6HRX1_IRIPA|nr:trans-resveratrol di-O-methyltransferase-like [Iris pallida]
MRQVEHSALDLREGLGYRPGHAPGPSSHVHQGPQPSEQLAAALNEHLVGEVGIALHPFVHQHVELAPLARRIPYAHPVAHFERGRRLVPFEPGAEGMPRLQKCLVQHQGQEWRKALALLLDKDRGEGGERECVFFFFFFWFSVVAASCCEESRVHQAAHEMAQARSSRRRNIQRCRQLRERDGISAVVNRVGYR